MTQGEQPRCCSPDRTVPAGHSLLLQNLAPPSCPPVRRRIRARLRAGQRLDLIVSDWRRSARTRCSLGRGGAWEAACCHVMAIALTPPRSGWRLGGLERRGERFSLASGIKGRTSGAGGPGRGRSVCQLARPGGRAGTSWGCGPRGPGEVRDWDGGG